jgi:hypothetical protein
MEDNPLINVNPTIDAFMEAAPEHLREALVYCATPYWFQKSLAIKIIENIVQPDDSAQDTFYQLLNLPFIYRHDENTWQYTDTARNKMHAYMSTKEYRNKYKEVHRLVVNDIRSQLDTLINEGHADLPEGDEQTDIRSWQVRRLRWQLIYHLAPVDPKQAYKEFETIAKWANRNRDRLPMYKLAVEVWEKQARWLGAYKEEGAYYQGYFAYRTNDLARAENLFSLVWARDTTDIFMKADTGHLLGVIYRQKGQTRWYTEAEEILRASLEILEKDNDKENEDFLALKARILNSLAATLIQMGPYVIQTKAQENLEEAQFLLYESLSLERDVLGDVYGTTHVLNTLAGLHLMYHIRLNAGIINLHRAMEFIDETLDLSSQEGNDQDEMIHLNTKAEVLIQFGEENHLKAAEDLLHRCLEINKKIRDRRTQALSYSKLARVYYERGDEQSLRTSIKWSRRSLEVWKELENLLGQKECMELIAATHDLLGEPGKASSWRRQAYQLVA